MGMNRLNEWVLLLSEPEHPAVALYTDNFTLVKSKLTTDHWVCLRLAVSRWWAASHRISGSLRRVDQERPEWQPATLDVIEDSGPHYCQDYKDYKACSWSDKGPPSLTTHQHNHWSASFILALITLVLVSLFHNWPFLCGSWIRCPHGTFYYCHFFCHIVTKLWLASCKRLRKPGVPGEHHSLTTSHL